MECSYGKFPFKEFYYFCRKKVAILNYLAHIYLSGKSKQMQIGGFIADFVKGNKSKTHQQKIWNGIILHRKVDSFTDSHPIVREMIDKMRPEFGRYSAIVLDMYFDYFLATNFNRYSKQSLWYFSVQFSANTLLYYFSLPKKVQGFIFHFILSNRLYKYSKITGLKESLYIMSVYKIKSLQPEKCINYLMKNDTELENNFLIFFDELIQFTQNELKTA